MIYIIKKRQFCVIIIFVDYSFELWLGLSQKCVCIIFRVQEITKVSSGKTTVLFVVKHD